MPEYGRIDMVICVFKKGRVMIEIIVDELVYLLLVINVDSIYYITEFLK
jgi:hypothetical protein